MATNRMFGGLSVVLTCAVFAAGCEKKSEPTSNTAAPSATAQPATAELIVVMEKADAADGKKDKVVSKCTMCGLGMDGQGKFVSTAHEYQFHFCSEPCRNSFSKDPDKALMALKIP